MQWIVKPGTIWYHDEMAQRKVERTFRKIAFLPNVILLELIVDDSDKRRTVECGIPEYTLRYLEFH